MESWFEAHKEKNKTPNSFTPREEFNFTVTNYSSSWDAVVVISEAPDDFESAIFCTGGKSNERDRAEALTFSRSSHYQLYFKFLVGSGLRVNTKNSPIQE